MKFVSKLKYFFIFDRHGRTINSETRFLPAYLAVKPMILADRPGLRVQVPLYILKE
ncbi:hypothetical protein QUB60_00420 [Microcoleus sp. A2-C5]|uniref:hypothetical protein n=1 Tax=Microcoleus sp. A2-C2 TaxID=2818530 RepID=UPI002FD5910A